MTQLLKNLFSNSRTSAQWVTYHNMITLVKDFIRAERLHDYNMRLSALALMLPYVAASGRGKYANTLRLHLEQIAIFEVKYGVLLKTFKVIGLHTVCHNDHEWSGVWTNLSIYSDECS